METTSICWLVVFILLILIELATMGLTTIWFAGGAVAGFVASMLGANVVIQAAAFFAVSILLLFFTRPFAVRYINSNKTKTNVDGLIGQEALVLEEINNIRETGCAKLEGKEWTARSMNDTVIPKDTVVTVERIEGVKLIVKAK
ncbi:MAG: NfeD family protein [Lachnospiraceae bacterium]|nr:NfeD family protein [Lachnospiraceae bacterium]